MSQKFDELKEKIENADKDQITDLIQQVQQEDEKGNIDKDEKESLIDKAQSKVGQNIDFMN